MPPPASAAHSVPAAPPARAGDAATHPRGGSTVLVTTEQHFVRDAAGVWVTGNEDYRFFARYLCAFHTVRVVARVRAVDATPAGARRVDGPGVVVHDVPDFHGPGGLARRFPSVARALAGVVKSRQPVVLRVPGLLASLAWTWLRVLRRPYGLEVVGDPRAFFQPDTCGRRFAAAYRALAVRSLRAQCAGARCTAYVSERALQRGYPPGNALTWSYSSVDLDDQPFGYAPGVLERIRAQPDDLRAPTLIFVGRMQYPNKGLDVLLHAVAELGRGGRAVRLEVLGGGGLVPRYAALARELGVPDVRFHGEVNEPALVYQALSRADLFVLPSRHEGLSRAVIEAMAVGLPVVATDAGGNAELLEAEDLVPVNDAAALSRAVEGVLSSRDRRERASIRNHRRAADFRASVLLPRRRAFLRRLAGGWG